VLLGHSLLAQQVQSIDLTATPQHVELRHPPTSPNQNGGYGGSSIGDCGLDARDPRSLTVTVQNVIVRDGDDPTKPFEIEFEVLNTGKVPLRLPISPHLSELQPDDASATFTYKSLTLAVSPIEDRSSIGYIELYGKADRPETLMTVKPGEWLRVEADVEFNLKLPPAGTINLEPGYWLRDVTVHPHPSGFTTSGSNVCINEERPKPTIQVRRN
jgi:hypothetical protein